MQTAILSSKSNIEIDVADKATILNDKPILTNIIWSLLANCIMLRASRLLKINISYRSKKGWISINVVDTERNNLEKIFEPFSNLSMKSGKGLGLYCKI